MRSKLRGDEMLPLERPNMAPAFGTRIIDLDAGLQKSFHVRVILMLPPLAAILKPAVLKAEIFVDRSREYQHLAILKLLPVPKIIAAQDHGNVCKYLRHQRRVAICRQPLELVSHQPRLFIMSYVEPFCETGREGVRRYAPLFFRVSLDELLVHEPGHHRERRLLKIRGLALKARRPRLT